MKVSEKFLIISEKYKLELPKVLSPIKYFIIVHRKHNVLLHFSTEVQLNVIRSHSCTGIFEKSSPIHVRFYIKHVARI